MADTLLERILKAEICPYCHRETEYIDSAELYERSFGMIYICRSCNAYVNVHAGTNIAMGGLANTGLRRLRRRAHDIFNSIYETGFINQLSPDYVPNTTNRQKAYKWLAKQMNIPEEKCHIGMLDVDDCYRVIDICERFLKSKSR